MLSLLLRLALIKFLPLVIFYNWSLSHASLNLILLSCLLLLVLVQLFACQGKYFLNVETGLGTRLKELIDAVLLAKLNCPLSSHFTLVFQVCSVANQIDHDVLTCMLLYLLQPVYYVRECLFTGNIVSEEYAMSSSVEYTSNRPERLLTCSVPDLQFDNLLIDCEHE